MSDGGNEYKNGLFGCFGDFRLCLLTFVVPCYTIGKNAESLGEDCLLIGLMAALGLHMYPLIRWRVRSEKNIAGSMLMDVVCGTFCELCAAIQDARELGWHDKQQEEKAQSNQNMVRQ